MEIVNIEQGTPEWHELRKLKLTASNAQAIAAQGKGLETYCLEVVAAYLSKATPESYTNEHMQRGNELEASARFVYEAEQSLEVKEVGFVLMNEYVGCSPDGLVGDDGLIEIKCKNDKNHLEQIIDGEMGIETSYIWQMQMQMLICKRNWCDFVCYNPNFEKSLLIYRVKKDEAKQEKLKSGIEKGILRIKEILEQVHNVR